MRVPQDAFHGALKRFAAVFHQPVFKPEVVASKVATIDSEFRALLQNDMYRINQLCRTLSKPTSPIATFGIGNASTLTYPKKDNSSSGTEGSGPAFAETCDRLHQWWSEKYCASRMVVVLVSPGEGQCAHLAFKLMSSAEPLHDMTELAVTLFSPIASRVGNISGQIDVAPTFQSPWDEEQEGVSGLNLTWEYADIIPVSDICKKCRPSVESSGYVDSTIMRSVLQG